MKRPASHSISLSFALALSAINIVLFVIGIRWVHGVMSDLSSSSENESVLAAAEDVDQAYGIVMSTLSVIVWGACLFGGALLLALVLRQWKASAHAMEEAEIRSYTKNLAHAKRRRRHKKRASGRFWQLVR